MRHAADDPGTGRVGAHLNQRKHRAGLVAAQKHERRPRGRVTRISRK